MSQRSRLDAGRHRHRAGVRAAAAQGGNAVARRHALEARHHRHLALAPGWRAISEAGTPSMRAEPCTAEVSIGTCQPSQERAFTPMAFRVMARSPAVTCSPAATTTSYSRGSGIGWASSLPAIGGVAASLVQATSLLVSPAMAETTTATWLPRSTSRFTSAATWRMRSRSATEVPPNFIAIVAIDLAPGLPCLCGGLHRRRAPSRSTLETP